MPLVRPRKHSLFSLTENPLVIIDEPEQAAGASERLWKRLQENPDRPFPCPPDANFLHLARTARKLLKETPNSPSAN